MEKERERESEKRKDRANGMEKGKKNDKKLKYNKTVGTGLIEKQIKPYQPIKLVTVRLQIVHNNGYNHWNKMQFQFLFCIEFIVYFPFDVAISSILFGHILLLFFHSFCGFCFWWPFGKIVQTRRLQNAYLF